MRLAFTPNAQTDLMAIGEYIARDNPERALSFVDELFARCQRISEHPTAFRQREELGGAVRCAPHGNYQIVFEADEDSVLILRIVHGRMNLPQLLGE